VDFKPPLRDVIRFAAVVEFLGLPIETRTFPDGRLVPAGGELARACVHVQLEQTTHAPAFAINRANTFTAQFGVKFWDGTTRHDLPVDVRLADTTNGPPVLIDTATVTNGQWQTTIRPSTAGLNTYQFDANLSGIGAAEVGAGELFSALVRDRIELQAKRAQDTTFADTIGPVQAGTTVTLRVRLAGDGMAFGTFALANSGAGTLGASSGVTNQQGEAFVTYTAPASRGSDTITATGNGASDTLTITVEAAVSVSVTPASITLAPGQQTTFTASVTGTTNQTVTWSATGGTIDANGGYTAGSTNGTFTVTATSVADTSATTTASVTVVVPVPDFVVPSSYFGDYVLCSHLFPGQNCNPFTGAIASFIHPQSNPSEVHLVMASRCRSDTVLASREYKVTVTGNTFTGVEVVRTFGLPCDSTPPSLTLTGSLSSCNVSVSVSNGDSFGGVRVAPTCP
jgi:hypothetical protein